jgi:RimJ/RimL family protein N-acetyltransferase
MEVPRLADDVVVLDAFTPADAEAHLAGEDEEQARRFGWYPKRSTPATVRDAFARWAEAWRNEGATRAFAMRELESGALVGGCEIRLSGGPSAEISYWTFPHHRRKGYATRAVRLLTAFAFAQLAVKRIEAQVEPDNPASRRVIEGAGFVEEGLLPGVDHTESGEVRDMVLYSLRPPAGYRDASGGEGTLGLQ